jgi:HSP20 family protein
VDNFRSGHLTTAPVRAGKEAHMFVRRTWPAGLWSEGFPELERMQRDMDRLFAALAEPGGGLSWAGVFPPVNVTQDDDRFVVRAVLPGVKPGEVNVSALGRRLTVSGAREVLTPESGASYHRRERDGGSFSRAIELGVDIDSSRVEAAMSDGVLTITLPKAESAKPRQITVKAS